MHTIIINSGVNFWSGITIIIEWIRKQQWNKHGSDLKGFTRSHFNMSDTEIHLQAMAEARQPSRWNYCLSTNSALHVATSIQFCALWLLHMSLIAPKKLFLKYALQVSSFCLNRKQGKREAMHKFAITAIPICCWRNGCNFSYFLIRQQSCALWDLRK